MFSPHSFRKLPFLLLFVLLAALQSHGQNTGTLSGVVTNAESGAPIVGAKVTLNTSPGTTTYTVAGGAVHTECLSLRNFYDNCGKDRI